MRGLFSETRPTQHPTAGLVLTNIGVMKITSLVITVAPRLEIIPQSDKAGSSLIQGYNRLGGIYKHQYINHKSDEYVRGDVHTQNIENVWSQLKRSIYGCYHSVSVKHLQAYCNESAFRYNTRTKSEDGRFDLMLSNISSHITYNDLINRNDRSKETLGVNRKMEGEQGTLSL